MSVMEMQFYEQRGYALPMRIIHWLMALLMIYVISIGLLLSFGVKVGQHYDYHRATGFILLVLVLVRFAIKWVSPAPVPKHSGSPGLQQMIARVVHSLLYTMLLVQPLLGWYATNAWGVGRIPFFGITHLPRIAEKNRDLGNMLLEIHHYVGLFVTALVAFHVGAALFHHFVKRDEVLMRMVRG
ncbi:MAG: cytochrome b [Lentilitoribacter sp.]